MNKHSFNHSINKFSEGKISDAIQLLGKSLPCSVVAVVGGIVTVKFEIETGFTLPQVAIPVFGTEYIRWPIQIGCKGVVLAMDARIGNMSGLGAPHPSDLTEPGNLTSLVFLPVANSTWSAVNGNQLVMYGPHGAVVGNQAMTCVISLTDTGIAITLPSGGSVAVTGGDVIADGISLKTHHHNLTQPGTGNSGGPV